MLELKIKISDEPRIIASAIRDPFQVVLSFLNNPKDIVTGILDGEDFVYSSSDAKKFKSVVNMLVDNKISFHISATNP
jgi:hypothetical protein